jgi:aconitate hydratase 2/2-methylisocitrate dehydratase
MTNIGHFRAAGRMLEQYGEPVPTRLWVVPPTKMDQAQLIEEGYYAKFAIAGARTEVPGCSLCMGNQARVAPGATVVSTSTRNFPNRLGKGANVFLSSAEVAAVASMLGRIPTVEEYMKYAAELDHMAGDVYRYLNFDQLPSFTERAKSAKLPLLHA